MNPKPKFETTLSAAQGAALLQIEKDFVTALADGVTYEVAWSARCEALKTMLGEEEESEFDNAG